MKNKLLKKNIVYGSMIGLIILVAIGTMSINKSSTDTLGADITEESIIDETVIVEDNTALEEMELKKASLQTFSRVKKDNDEVVELVVEVLKDEKIAELEQARIDDLAEIKRRQDHLEMVELELLTLKK